ncbi:MAG: 6-carboxytetrahydropterin synthase QueD [Acidobacteriota bacterium]
MILKRVFRFEAAHQLPDYPGKCRRFHGHSYRMTVFLKLPVDPESGLAMDFAEIQRIVDQNVISKLDHQNLNEIIDNPTSERLIMWIWDQLEGKLNGIYELELSETESSSVIYRKHDP